MVIPLHSEPGRLKLDYDKKASLLTTRSSDDIFKLVQNGNSQKVGLLRDMGLATRRNIYKY